MVLGSSGCNIENLFMQCQGKSGSREIGGESNNPGERYIFDYDISNKSYEKLVCFKYNQ